MSIQSDKDKINILVDYLKDNLPHGSGIDSTWQINYNPKTNKIYCTNSYHAMNEYGYYVAWLDFMAVYRVNLHPQLVECKYCKGLGERDVKTGTLPEIHGFKGNLPFTCNVCNGKGKMMQRSLYLDRVNFINGCRDYNYTKDYLYEILSESSLYWNGIPDTDNGQGYVWTSE